MSLLMHLKINIFLTSNFRFWKGHFMKPAFWEKLFLIKYMWKGMLKTFICFCLRGDPVSYTMVKSGFNLRGLTPQVFLMDSLFYDRDNTFFYKRHLNILRGFCRVTAIKNHYKINNLTSTAYGATVC